MSNDKARAKRLMDNFKLTIEQDDAITAYQGGVCWLCGRPEPTGKRLSTDHAHEDGLIRGKLCSQCNPLLGKLENAFVRFGMRKAGLSLINVVARISLYLASPPATKALGAKHFGYAGRTGTKAHKRLLKRLRKTMPHTGKLMR